MITQEMVDNVPCHSDERGHLLNAHRQCQWCHADEFALTKQLLGFWVLPRLIELRRHRKESPNDGPFDSDFDHAIVIARKLTE